MATAYQQLRIVATDAADLAAVKKHLDNFDCTVGTSECYGLRADDDAALTITVDLPAWVI